MQWECRLTLNRVCWQDPGVCWGWLQDLICSGINLPHWHPENGTKWHQQMKDNTGKHRVAAKVTWPKKDFARRAKEGWSIREHHPALGGSCATRGCLASLFVNMLETDLGILIMDSCQFSLEQGFLSSHSPPQKKIILENKP